MPRDWTWGEGSEDLRGLGARGPSRRRTDLPGSRLEGRGGSGMGGWKEASAWGAGLDPEARWPREGSRNQLRTVVSTRLEGPSSSPQLPLTPGWSQPCLFPSCHPLEDGEAWFSPNPADTSSLCPSLTLPPREAPGQPPKMSRQDGAPATHSSSPDGPRKGKWVTRSHPACGPLSTPGAHLPDAPHRGPGRLGEEPPTLATVHRRKPRVQERPRSPKNSHLREPGSRALNPGPDRRTSLLKGLRRRRRANRTQPRPPGPSGGDGAVTDGDIPALVRAAMGDPRRPDPVGVKKGFLQEGQLIET